MNRETMDLIQDLFSLTMSAMKSEEIMLKQEQMKRQIEAYKNNVTQSAMHEISYCADIIRMSESITCRRAEAFEIFDKLKVMD